MIKEIDNIKTYGKEASESSNSNLTDKDTDNSFFYARGVKKSKNKALKNRLQTLINDRGLTELEFRRELGVSRQYWYGISWGLFTITKILKLRIAKLLDTDTSIIFDNLNLENGTK